MNNQTVTEIDFLNIQVMMYGGNFSNETPTSITLGKSLSRIKQGANKQTIEKIRVESDKEKRNKIKSTLPSVMYFASNSTGRQAEQITEYSCLLPLDFDLTTSEEAKQKKIELKKHVNILSCWISPSGNGVKALVHTSTTNYKGHFKALQKVFSGVDPQCKNINRLCFESYDPDLWYNYKAETFTEIGEEEIKTYSQPNFINDPNSERADISEAVEIVEGWMDKNNKTFSEGNRNGFIAEMVVILLEHGYGKNEIDQALKYKYLPSEGFPASELEGIIKNRKSNHTGKIISSHKKKEIIGFTIQEKKTDLKKEIVSVPETVATIPTESNKLQSFFELEHRNFFDIPMADPVITMSGRTISRTEGITTILGQEGSFKSCIVSLIEAGMLASMQFPTEANGFITQIINGKPIIRIDTEQSKDECKILIKRLKKLLRTNSIPDWYFLFALKGEDPENIISMLPLLFVEMEKRYGGVGALFIDGIGDLIDVNDKKQSDELVRLLEKISKDYQCPIFCVLHQNPAGGNGVSDKGTGHLGTKLGRKSGAVLVVEMKGDDILVKAKKVRSGKRGVEHCYRWNDEKGFIEFVADLTETQNQNKRTGKITGREAFEKIKYQLSKPLNYTKLVELVCECLGIADRKAKSLVAEMNGEFVTKNEEGLYQIISENDQF